MVPMITAITHSLLPGSAVFIVVPSDLMRLKQINLQTSSTQKEKFSKANRMSRPYQEQRVRIKARLPLNDSFNDPLLFTVGAQVNQTVDVVFCLIIILVIMRATEINPVVTFLSTSLKFVGDELGSRTSQHRFSICSRSWFSRSFGNFNRELFKFCGGILYVPPPN